MKSCPTNKVRYDTEEEAWRAAVMLWDKVDHMNKSVYKCQCGSYHLSSRSGVVPQWVKDKRNQLAVAKNRRERRRRLKARRETLQVKS